jgi:hypothetical protein
MSRVCFVTGRGKVQDGEFSTPDPLRGIDKSGFIPSFATDG